MWVTLGRGEKFPARPSENEDDARLSFCSARDGPVLFFLSISLRARLSNERREFWGTRALCV